MKKVLNLFIAVLLIVFTIFIVGINVFASVFMGKDANLKQYFNDLNTDVDIYRIPFAEDSIRFAQTGIDNDSAATILFIHGAPGSLADYKSYLADFDLKSKFRLLALDRLGYGDSRSGTAENDLNLQAKAAASVLRSLSSSEVYVMGHSYGAAIAAKLALNEAGLVDGLIMCAALIDPESEPMPWYVHLANTSIMRNLLPEFINTASDEKMEHAKALKRIEAEWGELSTPVLHIHGKKDGLAPFEENINFSKNNIPNEYLKLDEQEKMGHLLIWMNAGYIKKKLISFIEQCREKD